VINFSAKRFTQHLYGYYYCTNATIAVATDDWHSHCQLQFFDWILSRILHNVCINVVSHCFLFR